MVARLPLLFVLGSLGLACGADPAPEPMTQDKRVEIAPPQGASDAATTPPKPKKTAAEHHRDFMGGCTRRSGTSADYCECAWGEFRKELTDEDMDGTELDRTKVDHVKAQVLTACASFVSEDMVRADFAKACRGGKGELEPYCDCTWTELRKKFSPAELNDETTVESDRFKTTRAAVTKTCGNKMPETFSREAFLKTCAKDPADEKYCACAWKELRKQATPGEIEAGTFDQKTLFAQFEKTCAKLRTPKTAP